MAEAFQGTSFDRGKGEAEFSEVEDLIRQTLEESKKQTKEAVPPPQETPSFEKREEYKATTLSVPARPPLPPEKGKEKVPAPVKKEAPASSYENALKEYKVGDIVRAKVLKVDPSGVLVDINYKSDGLIPAEELSEKTYGAQEESIKVGDIIRAMIENLENKEGYVILSKRQADYETKWKIASDAYRNREVLEGKVVQALRGGLVVECTGIRGFIPASQVNKKAEETLESFVGKILQVKIIDVNIRQGKIVFSNKLASGEKAKVDARKIFDELEAGQVRHGKVASLKSFGAFVDLGGIEGLIHLSELSWKRVKHPSEVLKVGEELDVYVLGVDKINRKISLGLRELLPDPWVNAAEYYKPGQIVKAKVLRFAKFGAFVELEHSLEGLIHISELSKEPVKTPGDAVKIGDVVEVKVLRVIPEEQKIGLSIKDVQLANPTIVGKDRQAQKETKETVEPQPEEKKYTIADMMADKERDRAEKEEVQTEEETEEAT